MSTTTHRGLLGTGALLVAGTMTISSPPAQASEDRGEAAYWTGRLGLGLASGPTIPTWSDMKVMTGGRFTANYALEGGFAPELTAGAWVALQDGSGGYEGPTVIYLMPGLRWRFLDGPLTPFAAAHLGPTFNRAAYQDTTKPGFGFEPVLGLDWVVAGGFALEASVSYVVSAGAPLPHSSDTGTAGFFVFGLGLGASIPTID